MHGSYWEWDFGRPTQGLALESTVRKGLPELIRQRQVLEAIAERTSRRKASSFRDLVRELDLTEPAACDHLKRLWRERLIKAYGYRPARFHFRLEPGESLRELRFRLSLRGRKRLRWWKRRDMEQDEELLW